MFELFHKFRRQTSGATALEYALIAALVTLPIIPFAIVIGIELQTFFYYAASIF